MALTSKGYDGSITEADLPRWVRSARADYGVLGAGDWKVTTVAGQDRTISIAVGVGFGKAVVDTTDAAETVQLDTVASGSRWDTVVARRDYAANSTTFVALQGTSSQAISASRQVSDVGGTDDQPIALVRVTAGDQLPTGLVDLRCWAGNGGMYAAAVDALTYLDAPGSAVWIGGVQWVREVAANGTTSWQAGAHADVVQALHGAYAGQQIKRRVRRHNWSTDGNGDVIIMSGADFSGVLAASMVGASTFPLTFSVRVLSGNLVARMWDQSGLRPNTTFLATADVTYW